MAQRVNISVECENTLATQCEVIVNEFSSSASDEVAVYSVLSQSDYMDAGNIAIFLEVAARMVSFEAPAARVLVAPAWPPLLLVTLSRDPYRTPACYSHPLPQKSASQCLMHHSSQPRCSVPMVR